MWCTHCGSKIEGQFCPNCGAKSASATPPQQQIPVQAPYVENSKPKKKKKPFFLRGWFIILAIIVVIIIVLNSGGDTDAPADKATQLDWNDIELHEVIPEPEDTYGEIIYDSASSLSIKLSEIDEGEFKNYIKACANKGFTVDALETSMSYSADNADGYSLSLSYAESSQEMRIYLHAPDNDTPDPTTEPSKPEETETEPNSNVSNNGGLDPDFKAAMDAYEEFYDEYCDILSQYYANPTDLTLLQQYMELLEEAEEMNEAFEAWDSEEMTTEEAQYYLEVTNRVTQKLLDLAQ